MIAQLPAWLATSPLAFTIGLVVGVWVGGRYLIVRKRSDDQDRV